MSGTGLGTIPVGSYRIDASSSNIPASASDPLQVEDLTTHNVMSIEVVNNTAADVTLYLGPNTNLDVLMIAAGATDLVVVHQRQPCCISQNVRLSVRASANTAITTGRLVINLWGG